MARKRRKRKAVKTRKTYLYVYSPDNEIYCDDTNETVKGNMYLESRHWRELSRRIWIERGKKCEICGKRLPVRGDAAIHHDTYKNIGHETGKDLGLLCHECHKKVHENGNAASKADIQTIWNGMTYTQRAALLEAARGIISR